MANQSKFEIPPGFKARPDDVNVLEMDEYRPNERLQTVIPGIMAAIGEAFDKYQVTHKEYQIFREFLLKLADAPFGTIAGVSDIWFEALFDKTRGKDWKGSHANPEGPFYVKGTPLLDLPPQGTPYVLYRREEEPGERMLVRGKVTSLDGKPLAGAELDIWQASNNGWYSMVGFDPAQPDWNLRGRILSDAEGNYEFLTIKPPPYATPGTSDMLREVNAAFGHAHFRPAHIHFKITHPEMPKEFFTQLYFKGDPYIPHDRGRAAREEMAVEVKTCTDPAALERLNLSEPFRLIDHDFVLETK